METPNPGSCSQIGDCKLLPSIGVDSLRGSFLRQATTFETHDKVNPLKHNHAPSASAKSCK